MDPAKSPRLRGTVIALLLLGVGALVGHSVRGWWLGPGAAAIDSMGGSRAGGAGDGDGAEAAAEAAAEDAADWSDEVRGAAPTGARAAPNGLRHGIGGGRGRDGTPLDITALRALEQHRLVDPPVPVGSAPSRPTGRSSHDAGRDDPVSRDAWPDGEGAATADLPFAADARSGPRPGSEPEAEVAAAIDAHAPVLSRARPSVVGITTIHRRGAFAEEEGQGFGDVDGLPPSVDASSRGTGVVFDSAGLVLTALHVVADPEQILVQVPEVGTREAQLVGADPSTDLAVLRLEAPVVPGQTNGAAPERFATATLASQYEVARGDVVFALANEYHFQEPLSAGVVQQVVAHIRHVAVPPVHITNEYLEFDAASAPGTSGSPVFDRRGEVVGVLTRSGRSGRQSYALTSRTVRRVLEAMERGGGKVDRGHLGAQVDSVELRGLDQTLPHDGVGIRVDVAHPGYPANRAGLRPGDVIVRFDGRAIPDLSSFYEWVTWSEPGSRVELEVVRDGELIPAVAVQLGTLGDPPGETG